MEKTKIRLIVAPIVMGVICIVLAAYAAMFKSQLDAEREKVVMLNRQVIELDAENKQMRGIDAHLAEVTSKYEEQLNLVRGLQTSLNDARTEIGNKNAELEELRAANNDLTSRLNAASAALQGAQVETQKQGAQPIDEDMQGQ